MSLESDSAFEVYWNSRKGGAGCSKSDALRIWSDALAWSRPRVAAAIKQLKSKMVKCEKKAKAELETAFILPSWIPGELWCAFEEHRRKNRWLLTPYARLLTVRKLEKLKAEGQDPVACLEQTLERGYRGVFAAREDDASDQTFDRADKTPTGKRLIEQYKAENARLELRQKMMDGINHVGSKEDTAAPAANC